MIKYEFSTSEVITLDSIDQWVPIIAMSGISFEESERVLKELQRLKHGTISHKQFLVATGMPDHVHCQISEC